jgi:HEAT repeat protein
MKTLLAVSLLVSSGELWAQEKPADEARVAALIRELEAQDTMRQLNALGEMRALGPQAKPAVPVLRQMLKKADLQVSSELIAVLGTIGPGAKEAVPDLTALIKKQPPNAFLSQQAGWAIMEITGTLDTESMRVLLMTNQIKVGTPVLSGALLERLVPDGLPNLIGLLKDSDPNVRERAAHSLGELANPYGKRVKPLQKSDADRSGAIRGLEPVLCDTVVAVRREAATALMFLAPDRGPKVIEALLPLVKEGKLSGSELGHAVQHGDENLAPPLIAALDEPDADIRGHIAQANACAMYRTLPGLAKALREGKPNQRLGAAQALGHAYRNADAAAALKGALTDEDRAVRLEAAVSLAEVAEKNGGPAAPVLAAMLPDAGKADRLRILQCLEKLGPAAKEAIPALDRALEATEPDLRLQAAFARVKAGPAPADKVVLIFAATLSGKNERRGQAAHELGRIGPPARDALPALREALKDKNPWVQMAAAEAAFRIDQDQAKVTVPVLLDILKQEKKHSNARMHAIEVLGQMGPTARDAAPALRTILKDAKEPYRPSVAGSLLRIDPAEADDALTYLRAALSGKEESDEALDVLYDLGPVGKPLVPDLIGLLQAKETGKRVDAIRVLGGIGPAAKEAAPALRKLLETEKNLAVWRAAEKALKEIEPAP